MKVLGTASKKRRLLWLGSAVCLSLCFWSAPPVRAQNPVTPPENSGPPPAPEETPPLSEVEVSAGNHWTTPTPAIIINQTTKPAPEFGPIVTAYLAYLNAEQGVVDDSGSRHEVTSIYYRHNANRVRALRTMALRLARASASDYLPEMVAVGRSELHLLFEQPPPPNLLQTDEVYNNAFRYLGPISSGPDQFYIFARLDPYQQEELLRNGEK